MPLILNIIFISQLQGLTDESGKSGFSELIFQRKDKILHSLPNISCKLKGADSNFNLKCS